MPGWSSVFQKAAAYVGGSRLGYAANNMGRLASHVARGGMGGAAQAAMGAAIGGMYGATSDNTSVLGGALMGAGAMRYGASGIRRAALGRRGIGVGSPGMLGMGHGFYRGVVNRARMDARGVRMSANRGYGKIRGLF